MDEWMPLNERQAGGGGDDNNDGGGMDTFQANKQTAYKKNTIFGQWIEWLILIKHG